MTNPGTFRTQVHGLSFLCSDDGAVGRVVKKGEYELPEVRCLALMTRPGYTFVDAGANVGYFTLLAAKLVGSTGRVEAFEPDPFNQELLTTNVQENGFSQVTIHRCALGLKNGERFLYRSHDNVGDHRTWNDGKEIRPTVPVKVQSLDETFPDLSRVDVMKVDVQGDEMNVLRGGQGLIRQSPGMILTIEYWPYGLTTNGSSPVEFADFLYGNHFNVTAIMLDGKLLPLTRDDLLRIFNHNDDQVCNLLCIKGV